ncbi:MAG: ParA family protein [Pseudomonadota bacterium]
MKTLVVANPKGGSGKTTLATNLAAYLAGAGQRVAMMDMDRQQSASAWLDLREEGLPPIARFSQNANPAPDWLVIDSPAGLHGKMLERVLKLATRIVVPVSPSLFDIAASQDFLAALREERAVRKGKVFVGVVGMRIDPRTRMGLTLQEFLDQQGLPVLAYLRYAQSYVQAAFEGKSLFDLPHHLAARELEQWEYLIQWLNQETAA